MKKLFFPLVFAILILSSCKDEEDDTVYENPFLKTGAASMNVAHRGGRNLFPENTMVAFDSAALMGVDVLEMDVCLTKDGILVTNHDLTVDRTSDTVGNVIDFTFAELQEFNFGYWFRAADSTYPYRANPVRIPKLEDVFTQHGDKLMVIEIKDRTADGMLAADKLMALIREYDLTKRVVVFSSVDDVMGYVHSINDDGVWMGASFGDVYSFSTAVLDNPDTTLTVRAHMFALPIDLGNFDTEVIVNAAHRHNAAVHYWTVNDKDEMKALIQLGADGVMTDRPDVMDEALEELGL